jgi:hypothetical protein
MAENFSSDWSDWSNKITNTKCSANRKQDKFEENHSWTYNSQITENQR